MAPGASPRQTPCLRVHRPYVDLPCLLFACPHVHCSISAVTDPFLSGSPRSTDPCSSVAAGAVFLDEHLTPGSLASFALILARSCSRARTGCSARSPPPPRASGRAPWHSCCATLSKKPCAATGRPASRSWPAAATRPQALCLESYADLDTVRRWSVTWAGLSRACHYHGYELAPTQAELCAWRDDVERVIGALAPRTQ